MLKDFKNRLAALLRRWANRLAPPVHPTVLIHNHELRRFRISKFVKVRELEARRMFHKMPVERVRDILAQEAIVEAADEMAKLVVVEEVRGGMREPELHIKAEFYFNDKI